MQCPTPRYRLTSAIAMQVNHTQVAGILNKAPFDPAQSCTRIISVRKIRKFLATTVQDLPLLYACIGIQTLKTYICKYHCNMDHSVASLPLLYYTLHFPSSKSRPKIISVSALQQLLQQNACHFGRFFTSIAKEIIDSNLLPKIYG